MKILFISAILTLSTANQCFAEETMLLGGKTFYGHEVGDDRPKKWVEYFDVNGDAYYKSGSELIKSKWWRKDNKLCEKGTSPSSLRSCELLRRNGENIEILDVETGEVLSVIDKIIDGDIENFQIK